MESPELASKFLFNNSSSSPKHSEKFTLIETCKCNRPPILSTQSMDNRWANRSKVWVNKTPMRRCQSRHPRYVGPVPEHCWFAIGSLTIVRVLLLLSNARTLQFLSDLTYLLYSLLGRNNILRMVCIHLKQKIRMSVFLWSVLKLS